MNQHLVLTDSVDVKSLKPTVRLFCCLLKLLLCVFFLLNFTPLTRHIEHTSSFTFQNMSNVNLSPTALWQTLSNMFVLIRKYFVFVSIHH